MCVELEGIKLGRESKRELQSMLLCMERGATFASEEEEEEEQKKVLVAGSKPSRKEVRPSVHVCIMILCAIAFYKSAKPRSFTSQ